MVSIIAIHEEIWQIEAVEHTWLNGEPLLNNEASMESWPHSSKTSELNFEATSETFAVFRRRVVMSSTIPTGPSHAKDGI